MSDAGGKASTGVDPTRTATAIHGGPDADGVPAHDFSTNSNACGPCPEVMREVQRADATRYPDPAYTALREVLGAFHSVPGHRIVVAGSASEFIHRVTAWVARLAGGTVGLPAHSYGDYAQAAQAWGLPVVRSTASTGERQVARLQWACEPSSPLGLSDPALAQWRAQSNGPHTDFEFGIDTDADIGTLQVLDCAYVPLRLDGGRPDIPHTAWQLWTPNKALGLTGIRAAYAISPANAPMAHIHALQAMAPSWPLGAHGVAMLNAWVQPSVQQWLQASRVKLRCWKAEQQALCHALGWQEVPGSLANYFVARINVDDVPSTLVRLRHHGVKLRDCASFGLPGHVRLGVLAPASQQALRQAWADTVPSITRRA